MFPILFDNFGKDDFLNFNNNLTVPNTPPEKIIPLLVYLPDFLKNRAVDSSHITS